MKKQGYAESTIVATGKRLRNLSRHCDLTSPESVRAFIADKQCSNGFKESLVEAYDVWCRFQGVQWSKPFYDRYDKLPKIPTEERINILISNASRRMALILSMMRDLGTRPIELTWLKLRDIDLENGIVNVTSAKHCVGRALKLRAATLDMLKQYVIRKRLGLNNRLFPVKSASVSEAYRKLRNRLAEKLQDPTFKTIRLYDFRHFYATMTYHKTKDLLFVKAQLGHSDLRTTLRYTQLVNLGNEDYVCKAAKNVSEATQLIEQGFEFVCEVENAKLFRKRK
ncbi:site-specific integrase [Candidatus Bathyarchaeota archaeon]|nr:site-specific integrase [Candidatus Bathyarchaeota archaeon]